MAEEIVPFLLHSNFYEKCVEQGKLDELYNEARIWGYTHIYLVDTFMGEPKEIIEL